MAHEIRWMQMRMADEPTALRHVEQLKKDKGPVDIVVDVAVARAIAGDAQSALRLIDLLEPSEGKTQAWIRVASSLTSQAARDRRNPEPPVPAGR